MIALVPPERFSWCALLGGRFNPRSRGQAGYVLGVVLAAMAVGLLLITALLSLSFATHRAAIAQQRLAAEQRAVDGALETSLTRVRAGYNASAQLDPCAPFLAATPELDQIEFDAGTTATHDDTTVRVDCDEVLGSGAGSAETVQLVGDDYAEVPGWDRWTDWTAWNWSSALDPPVVPPGAALSPTLLHNGEEALRFNGNMAVRSGAAALLEAPDAEGAIDVRGSYQQGAAGHPGTGLQCGMLSPVFADGDAARTAVVDDDAQPECGGAASGLTATGVARGPTGDPPTSVPAGCPGGTFTFGPGDYGPAETSALNALFSLSCSTVYNFSAGEYWFDVSGGDHALVFDDASSAFVFGDLSGSGPDAACDPTAAAPTSVVLSGRTTIEHLAGNVSICAGSSGGDALVQSQVLPSGIAFPTTPVSGTHCFRLPCLSADKHADFTSVADVLAPASGGASAVGTADCVPVVVSSCKLSFSVDLAAASDTSMDSLELAWTSSESPNAHVSNRTVAVRITKGSTTLCYVPPQAAGRTTGFMTTLDLSSCAGIKDQPESVLDGAKMTVAFTYPNYWGGEQIKLTLRGLHMRLNAKEVDATAASSEATPAVPAPGVAWPNADPGVLTGDGSGSTYADPGPCGQGLDPPWICDRASNESVSLQPLSIAQFDVAGAGFDPNEDIISSLALAVDNVGGDNQIAAPSGAGVRGETWVQLTWATGSCTVERQQIQTYTRSSRTYFIDIIGAADSDCAVLAGQPMSLLEGATLKLSIRPERGMWIAGNPRYTSGLALPSFDHLRLVATSDVSRSFSRATITNDVASNTRFRVHGDVTMPRTSIDVRWTGTVDTDPIVEGSLQAHSLGSIADTGAGVGIVCCGPGSREVQIVAEIADGGGTWIPRGVARAVLTKDPDGALAAADVTGWQFCSGASCPTSGGGLGPPP